MPSPPCAPGRRAEMRRAFIAKHRWHDAHALRPDASARRYFRLRRGDATALLMDAPPGEKPGAFVTVTAHLAQLGARVPAIYAADLEHGFLLLEDLGEQTFARLLADGHDEAALYRRAVVALSHIHRRARVGGMDLPAYDAQAAWAESRLLIDWYLPARRRRPTPPAAAESFHCAWAEMLAELPPLAPTLVLRDFHIDNLMLAGDDCALLDYQDAALGSPAYDLASLLEDARRDVAPAVADEMMELYFAQNPGNRPAHDHERRDFRRHYIVWAAQRHCKVAGIFTRLWLRDGKDAYLRHLPRVLRLLRRHLHAPALSPLRDWLGAHFGEVAHVEITASRAQLLRHCAHS